MIEKKTIVSQITVDEYGNILVQLSFLLVDGDEEISRKFHRTSIPPEISPKQQMDFVNLHLSQMGEEPVSAAENAFIEKIHGTMKSFMPPRPKFRKGGRS